MTILSKEGMDLDNIEEDDEGAEERSMTTKTKSSLDVQYENQIEEFSRSYKLSELKSNPIFKQFLDDPDYVCPGLTPISEQVNLLHTPTWCEQFDVLFRRNLLN